MYIEKDTEVMLYDFSIKIGDTIKNDVIRISHLGSIILYSIDSVLIGNNYRKSFLFGLPGINNASPLLQWIEGIGYLRGLLFATGDLPSSGLWNNVICLTQENQETYHSSKYKNCFYKNTDAIIYPEESEISLYPNPIDKLSELKFPEDKFKKAVLYSINGSLIKEFDVQGKKSIIINKNSLPSGIYSIRLIGPRNTFTIKVIFK
jgi:hypothetical protein